MKNKKKKTLKASELNDLLVALANKWEGQIKYWQNNKRLAKTLPNPRDIDVRIGQLSTCIMELNSIIIKSN